MSAVRWVKDFVYAEWWAWRTSRHAKTCPICRGDYR